jgi:hypothetical protein
MRVKFVVQLALVAALVCSFGCSSNNKGKIEGTKWSSEAATMKGQQLQEGALKLEFGSDGRLVYKAGATTFTGTYSLGFGNTVTLNLDQELSGRKKHAQKVAINGDRLTMSDSDGTSMTFKKVQ